MARFRVAGRQDNSDVIEWSIEIDGDGDLVLKANNIAIAYVYSEEGEISPAWVSSTDADSLPGIKFDDSGFIAAWDGAWAD